MIKIGVQSAGNPDRFIDCASTGGTWQERVYPLSALEQQGTINWAQVTSPLIFNADPIPGPNQEWVVDHIRITMPISSINIVPSGVQQTSTGRHIQFTAEGVTAGGETVVIYPRFTTTSGVFTPNNFPIRSAVLTAGPFGGTIRAADGAVTRDQAFTIVPTPPRRFGLLSESIPGVELDVDSKLERFASGAGSSIDINDDFAEVREGVKSLRTTVQITQPTGFAFWYIQWGLNPSGGITRDMSGYYDGSLRFWFKAPGALQSKLIIGLRSGNVPPGAELSKVPLRNYYPFDNQWHPVTIPLSVFAKPPPWADLSRMKLLFAIIAEGQVTGTPQDRTFYVDHLRWDNQFPQALQRMEIHPPTAQMPFNSRRRFFARGYDRDNVEVDVWPDQWSLQPPGLGSLSGTSGAANTLTVFSTPGNLTVRAQQGALIGQSQVTIGPVAYAQSFNIFSDTGTGGLIGVSTGGANGTRFNLELATSPPHPPTPEGRYFMKFSYNLVNTPGRQDAWALWFVAEEFGDRFLKFYENGYINFWVKTTRDLQLSIRSSNIPVGEERSKVRLSQLGIPLDGQWHEVLLALDDFKNNPLFGDSRLRFEQMKVFFAIGVLSSQIGPGAGEFDIDFVRWLTADARQPNPAQVLQGLKDKQTPAGLVRSFAFRDIPDGHTYDQALAAMSFTYYQDRTSAQRLLDVFRNLYQAEPGMGFFEKYNVDTLVPMSGNRTVGPNAWILLAIMHYRNVFNNDTRYDVMMNGLANWLAQFQDPIDFAMKFGLVNGNPDPRKSTEHNLDCYSAFTAYSIIASNPAFATKAERIYRYLTTEMYNPDEQRFYVGKRENGTINTVERALDVYSWAPLSLGSQFRNVLPSAIRDFFNSQISIVTGEVVSGFDFAGPRDQPPDKDAVWLEGTAQMVEAYHVAGEPVSARAFIENVERGIFRSGDASQAATYATNPGTGYGGFPMDATNAAVSTMAWYIFAKHNFNPFRLFGVTDVQVRDMATHNDAPEIRWTAAPPARWIRANHYVLVSVQPITLETEVPWLMQIFTDNTSPLMNPRFVDPSPTITTNRDSDPAGLLLKLPGHSTTSIRIPMAWSVKDTTATVPVAADPARCLENPDSCQWLYLQDRARPALDLDGDGNTDVPAFAVGEHLSRVKGKDRTHEGIHVSQGERPEDYRPSLSPDYIFFEADFTGAAAQAEYETVVTLEFFHL